MKRCQVETTFYFADVNDKTVQQTLRALQTQSAVASFIEKNQGKPPDELQRAFVEFLEAPAQCRLRRIQAAPRGKNSRTSCYEQTRRYRHSRDSRRADTISILPVSFFLSSQTKQKSRECIGRLIKHVTTAERWDERSKPNTTVNVAFTYKGLVSLGAAGGIVVELPRGVRARHEGACARSCPTQAGTRLITGILVWHGGRARMAGRVWASTTRFGAEGVRNCMRFCRKAAERR